MDTTLRRGLVAELLGTFAIVYFAAGAVCVNALTASGGQANPSPLQNLQPGLVGIALAQGLTLAAALAVTIQLSGGYLNPAVTLMLWVFNRLDNKRTATLLVAQLIGAVLAGACLRFTFDDGVLRDAHLGTPHLSLAAFRKIDTSTIIAGSSVEFLITFFLVFAIFGAGRGNADPDRSPLAAGLMVVAMTILALPLTGAAANPARWLGTVLWEQMLPDAGNPWGDTFVFLAGPILGALAGGLVIYRVLLPGLLETGAAKVPPAPAVKKK